MRPPPLDLDPVVVHDGLDLDPVVVHDGPAARVTVVPAGWIAVRPAHHEFAGPWPLRYPALLADDRWHAWMPVNVVVVELADRVVLVDTGEAVAQPPGHFGCGNAGQEQFYRRHLRIPVRPGTEAPARLRRLGIDPLGVDTVVLTHLHSDHTGNLDAFPRARVVVGAHATTATGATACRLAGRVVVTPDLVDGPTPVSDRSHRLTGDDLVRVVPLPGHAPGHLGLLVVDGGRVIVAAGDAAFDHDQIRRRATTAVAEDRAANRATQARLQAVLDDGGQVLLAHDARPVVPG